MKFIIYFAVLLIIFSNFSCKEKEKPSFTITGSMTGKYDGYIFISHDNITDSSLIENGKFDFTGSVDGPTKTDLYLEEIPNKMMGFDNFMLENSTN